MQCDDIQTTEATTTAKKKTIKLFPENEFYVSQSVLFYFFFFVCEAAVDNGDWNVLKESGWQRSENKKTLFSYWMPFLYGTELLARRCWCKILIHSVGVADCRLAVEHTPQLRTCCTSSETSAQYKSLEQTVEGAHHNALKVTSKSSERNKSNEKNAKKLY